VQQFFKAGLVTLPINQSTGTPTVQVQHSQHETHLDILQIQKFGFASNPPVGSAVITLSLVGDAPRKLVVGSHNDGLRPKGIPSGGTVLYDAGGTLVSLPSNGTVVVSVGGTPILTVNNEGISVTGKITSTGDMIAAGISLDHHEHPVDGASTGPPYRS